MSNTTLSSSVNEDKLNVIIRSFGTLINVIWDGIEPSQYIIKLYLCTIKERTIIETTAGGPIIVNLSSCVWEGEQVMKALGFSKKNLIIQYPTVAIPTIEDVRLVDEVKVDSKKTSYTFLNILPGNYLIEVIANDNVNGLIARTSPRHISVFPGSGGPETDSFKVTHSSKFVDEIKGSFLNFKEKVYYLKDSDKVSSLSD